MRLGKVIGNVISTSKYEKLNGVKLVVVVPIDPEGNEIGIPLIVGDYLNAGSGELIFWIEDGSTICKQMNTKNIPLRGCITGIADQVDI